MYGVRLAFSLVQSWWAGTARSREKANSMRDPLVTHDIPQNSWPTEEIVITASTRPAGRLFTKIATAVGSASSVAVALIASGSFAANVIASSTIQPMTAE